MIRAKRLVALALAIAMLFTMVAMLVACNRNGKIDNETTRLVLASSELDGVFNPFFSSSAPDGEIVGMTQISMLSSNKEGKVAYGENEACVVLDYSEEVVNGGANTVYQFVLKNNLKFSNGSPLTMKDVLFNLYVYLDPAYTGSATIYSTEIVGLAEYRTQIKDNTNEQDNFEATYETYAWDRIERLADALDQIYKDFNKTQPPTPATDERVEEALGEVVKRYQGYADAEKNPAQKEQWLKYTTMVKDYTKAKELYMQELIDDYTLSIGTAEEIKFAEDRISLTTDTEAFLYNEGFITWVEDETEEMGGHLEYALGYGDSSKNMSRDEAIQAVYNSYVATQTASTGMIQILLYSGTTSTLVSEFAAQEKKEYFDSLDESERVKNVEGITFANRTKSVTVNGKTYEVPTYNADGSVARGNEVLQIVIKKVDPKAIWNFGFTVAPMYYYSNPEQIALFDYEEHFGVDFGNINFMNDTVKATAKMGVPVGAGPYKATTRDGKSDEVTAATFKSNNVVYFERNEHFMFDVKIKYVNYQVVDTKQILDSLFAGDIHFGEPACKQENIDILDNHEGFDGDRVMTNGYGYIGINAEKVPSLEVRKAIMHAINTELCIQYYAGYSYRIYRPMTKASWAYPTGTDEEGQYYKYDSSGETSENLVVGAGYVKNGKGIYAKGDDVLEYTFTIAGDSEDHPAFNAMQNAANILNAHGFKVTVKKDLNALKKLNTGDLAIWAAAWGSGVDPDMYQVYHIDSLAGSTANWGYRAIRRNNNHKYDEELKLVQELSDIIDKARETLDISVRTELYAEALELVMQLAVELPTYQRSDLYAYNTKVLDVNTLTPKADLTPFNGPLSHIWNVSFNESK